MANFFDLDNPSLKLPGRRSKRVAPPSLGINEVDDDSEVIEINGERIDVAEVVTQKAARTYNAFSVQLVGGTATAPGPSTVILQNDYKRARVVIRNNAAQAVIIGSPGQVSSGSGYRLPAAGELEMFNQAAVNACVPSGTTQAGEISVLVESEEGASFA